MQSIRKHWFLAALIVLLLAGYFFARQSEWLASSSSLKWSIVSITMFVMAWPLEFRSLRQTLFRPFAPLLASSLNVIAIPLLVWPLAPWAGAELGPGMIVAAATPCTLASAAVWTRRAGGNDSVAIMVTIITNATCFLVMPFWIYLQTGNTIASSLLTGTIYKLFLFVVLPISLAQLVRLENRSAAWATRNKPMLSLLALLGILSMVFLGAVNMSLRLEQQQAQLQLGEVMFAIITLTVVHCAVFWGGIGLARVIRLPADEQIAIGFSGSQKTLMIGLSVAINLGMNIIPIVAYHAIQLIVDTVFADRIRTRSD